MRSIQKKIIGVGEHHKRCVEKVCESIGLGVLNTGIG